MFGKVVQVTCDECLDATLTASAGGQRRVWELAREAGWRSFAHPSGESWRGRIHVCVRCLEYGRPYERDAEGRPVRARVAASPLGIPGERRRPRPLQRRRHRKAPGDPR